MSPLEQHASLRIHVDLEALRRVAPQMEGRVRAATAAFGHMAQSLHAPMQALGDAAAILRDTPRSRVTRRAQRRRVTRQLRQQQRDVRAQREARRRHLRAHQYVEHHPGSTPLPDDFARDLRASTTAMRSHRP